MKKTLLITIALIGFQISLEAQIWDRTTEPQKIGGTVNSLAEESMPVFSKDSSKLYFVRTYDEVNKGGEEDQDVWFSVQEESTVYKQCERVTSMNNKYNNAIVSINDANNVAYMLNAYDGKRDLEKGISKSTYKNGSWSKPEKVNVPNLNIEGNYYGFHVSGDEKVMLISYTGPNSLGEEDLYVSTKKGSSWSEPQHMGSAINSSGFEISPFLSPKKDTLFFSSNGFGGEGDADIFYAVKQGDWTSWSEPVNLGSKINSPKFDAYFTYSDNQAYWSSNRDSELSDIWMLRKLSLPPPPEVFVECTPASKYNADDGAAVVAEVKGGTEPIEMVWSNGMVGDKLEGLGPGEYTVTVTDSFGLSASATCVVEEPDPVDVEEIVEINEIYFDLNSSKIRPDAAIELDKVVAVLNNNPKMVIELGSHTDCRASKKYNEWLSDRRAKSSAEYIKSRISNPERISGKGYGESKLLNGCECEGNVKSDCSEEEHQLNRRTEFKIIEVGSDKIIVDNKGHDSFD